SSHIIKMKFKLHLIAWTVLVTCAGADLSLFSTEEFIEQNGNIDDRLYLFSNSKECSERLTDVNKQHICKDYCLSVAVKEEKTNKAMTDANLPSLIQNKATHSDLNLNLTGALAHYKSFVHTFLTFIKLQDHVEDIFEYKIGVELNKFQITKLEKFSNSVNESDTANTILDITDILKEMFVQVEMNKKPGFVDKILIFVQNEIIDSNILYFFLILSSVILSSAILYIYFKRYQVNVTLRKVMAVVMFGLFISSVVNNHKYLSQKKHILNQQKLKETVPEECLISSQDAQKEKSVYSNLVSFIRSQVGYSATSRICLEYHEALFIASGHNNYVETVIYTISEGIRPIAVFFGKSINEFFSALTQDLVFYQYVPLIAMVTILFVPIAVIFICFICLVLFGYEFNFFHLFSFKKTQHKVLPNSITNENLLPLLNMIKNETNKLQINTLGANECLPSVESENLSENLTRSLRVIFERINEKQLAAREEINNLKNEKKNLCIKDYQQDGEMEKSEIEEARCLTIEYMDSENMPADHQDKAVSKQVSIGMSKLAKSKIKKSESKHESNLVKENLIETNNEEESEDEDIFVILDEN
ncbi:hypothetical protein BpHYR1_014584, partial [Brachionus plicatilis]